MSLTTIFEYLREYLSPTTGNSLNESSDQSIVARFSHTISSSSLSSILWVGVVASLPEGNQVGEEEDVEWGKVEEECLVENVEEAVDEPGQFASQSAV